MHVLLIWIYFNCFWQLQLLSSNSSLQPNCSCYYCRPTLLCSPTVHVTTVVPLFFAAQLFMLLLSSHSSLQSNCSCYYCRPPLLYSPTAHVTTVVPLFFAANYSCYYCRPMHYSLLPNCSWYSNTTWKPQTDYLWSSLKEI